jgi:hypothetical protein
LGELSADELSADELSADKLPLCRIKEKKIAKEISQRITNVTNMTTKQSNYINKFLPGGMV